MHICDVTDESMEAVKAFLREHRDTSQILSANLATHGSRLSDHLNSGNFKVVEEDGQVLAVFCLTRRGNLVIETAGRTDFGAAIVDACRSEPIAIQGVLGEWVTADATWQQVLRQPGFLERYRVRNVLQRLDLTKVTLRSGPHVRVRLLSPADFERWDPLNRAFYEEEGLPVQGTAEQRRASFCDNARAGYWWGWVEDESLVATVALNAVNEDVGQIGGVYTAPHLRRQGLSRALMRALIDDSIRLHGLTRLLLFTGENNDAALSLYDSLGFVRVGAFALCFGGVTDGDARDA